MRGALWDSATTDPRNILYSQLVAAASVFTLPDQGHPSAQATPPSTGFAPRHVRRSKTTMTLLDPDGWKRRRALTGCDGAALGSRRALVPAARNREPDGGSENRV